MAIMLMAIQLSFSSSNSSSTAILGDMPGYGLYYFFTEKKTEKKSVKTLLAYALSVHTRIKPAQSNGERESKRKKGLFDPDEYAHIRTFCFLNNFFSHTSQLGDDSI